jgi:hypothetical protein
MKFAASTMLEDHLEAHKILDQVTLTKSLTPGNILFDIDEEANRLYQLDKSKSTAELKRHNHLDPFNIPSNTN